MQITEKIRMLMVREGEGVQGGGATAAPVAPQETPVQTPAPPAETPAAPEPAPNAPPAWATARIGELTAKRREAEEALAKERQRIAELEAKLAQQQGQQPQAVTPPPQSGKLYTPEEVQAEARRIAAEQAYTESANKVYYAGQSKYPDFANAVTNINAAFGAMPREFVEAAIETGRPEEVIYALSKDLNKAAEIMSAGSPTRVAAMTLRFAQSLGGAPQAPAAKPQGTPVSQAPAPITPMVQGGAGTVMPSLDSPNLSMEDFMRIRREQTRPAHRN